MADWKNFESDLNKWLIKEAKDGIEYRSPYQAIIGFDKKRGFHSDGMLTKNKVLIAIEIEVGQTHPDTNVAKYWLLHECGSVKYKKIVLIHIYTPAFKSHKSRAELGEFISKKMMRKNPIRYLLNVINEGQSYENALKRTKSLIRKIINDEF